MKSEICFCLPQIGHRGARKLSTCRGSVCPVFRFLFQNSTVEVSFDIIVLPLAHHLLAMSVRKLSPTANLLRNSRLFGLPPPLPRPTADFTGVSNFESNTATTPYPTHASIETTDKSLGRGDWGLKRQLPLRSTTRTSTPVIRIGNVDSIDYITDFTSSADQSRSLEKWQELNMPVSAMTRERRATNYNPPPQSVFEPQYDSTAGEDNEAQRWKFSGPWLAGLEEGEFSDYLKQKVEKRKLEFREFLRRRLVKTEETRRRREMLEEGEALEDPEKSEQGKLEVSEAALDMHIKRIRKNEPFMQELVNDFLDLPRRNKFQTGSLGRASYNDKGPPITHPSAGLSYLRTASHTFNHPLHGPQGDKPPVEARVLNPQGEFGKVRRRAVIGVAGVVTQDSKHPFSTGDDLAQVERFEPELKGGGKVWVKPTRAHIDVDGKIQLETKRAETNPLNVLKIDRGESVNPVPAAAISGFNDRSIRSIIGQKSKENSTTGGYGLEDLGEIPRRPRTEPINKEGELTQLISKVLRQPQRGNR